MTMISVHSQSKQSSIFMFWEQLVILAHNNPTCHLLNFKYCLKVNVLFAKYCRNFRFVLGAFFGCVFFFPWGQSAAIKWILKDLTSEHKHGGVSALLGSVGLRLLGDKGGKAVLSPEPHVDHNEESRRKWVQRPDSAVCTFSWVQKKKNAVVHVPVLPRLPRLSLLASAGQRHSVRLRAEFSQLGVLGCVAACLYWSMDFLVAACTYLNIPPGHCSVFPASNSPPTPTPTPPHLQPAALPHTLFPGLSVLHPTVQSSLLLSFSSLCTVFLLLPGLFLLTVSSALSPLTLSSRGREKKQDGVDLERSLLHSFTGEYSGQNNYTVGFGWLGRKITPCTSDCWEACSCFHGG